MAGKRYQLIAEYLSIGNANFALLSAGAGTGGFISAATTASAITTASKAVSSIDSAITSVNSRPTLAQQLTQLTYAIDNLSGVKVNAEGVSQQDFGY